MSDYFDYGKDTPRSQLLSTLRGVPIVSYGYISEVIDDHYVRVTPVVQDSEDFHRVCDVTLVGLTSALFEVSVQPQVNDLVMMLSPNRFEAGMFEEVTSRADEKKVIYDTTTRGYSTNALIGILLSTIKDVSSVSARFRMDGEDAVMDIDSSAKTNITLTADVGIGIVSGDGEDKPVDFLLGENRPATVDIRSQVTKRVGFNGKEEDEAIEAPQSVTYSELAPITESYGASRDIKVGFDGITDSDEPTDAPTTIAYSEKAPVDIAFGAAVKLTFSPDDTDAPVDITLGQKSQLTVTSEAGVDLTTKKAINIVSDGSELITLKNSVASLIEILDEYNDILNNFDTVGSPASHSTGPGAKSKLASLKQKQGKVFG